MALQKFIVSRDESIYEAWPDIILTEKGKLICIFTECEEHLNRSKSRIVYRESQDRGRTWGEKKFFTEVCTAEEYYNCARISKMNDGRLAIICDKISKNENEQSEIHVWFGDSEGENWGEKTVYPFKGIVPDKLLQLKNGRIIISAHFALPKIDGKRRECEQYLWYSDDNGKTWSNRVTVAAKEDYFICEASILECPDGKLVAFLRENSVMGRPILKVISYDNGETWSEVYNTSIDCGHRPVSGFLKDGRVMITYRYIPSNTQNVFVAFMQPSTLEKTTVREQRLRIMPLDYDRNPAPDLGYTGWVQFDDGEIYVVNYIKDDSDKAYIRGYSFYPSDVELEQKPTATKNVF